MKTVTGKKLSSKRVPVAGARTFLSEFVINDTGASQAIAAYLQRATSSFDELLRAHSRTRSWRDTGGVEAETKTEESGGWEMRLKRKAGGEEEMEVGTEERKQRKKKKKRRKDGEDDH